MDMQAEFGKGLNSSPAKNNLSRERLMSIKLKDQKGRENNLILERLFFAGEEFKPFPNSACISMY